MSELAPIDLNSTSLFARVEIGNGLSPDPLSGLDSAGKKLREAAYKVRVELQDLAADSDRFVKLNTAFGKEWDQNAATALLEKWLSGNFADLPSVQIIGDQILGAGSGAFSPENHTIYLSSRLFQESTTNSDPLTGVTGVLLEEVGHFIDSRINRSDAAGDEGEIFARTVLDVPISEGDFSVLQGENDSGTIFINGKKTVVEFSTPASFGINLNSIHYNRSGNKFVAANRTGGTRLWCTDFAYGRAMEKGLFRNNQGIGARISGNAGVWDDQAGSWTRTARANSFVVWDPNQGGASSVGHVAFVERVNSDRSFVVTEAGWNFQTPWNSSNTFSSRTVRPGTAAFNSAKFVYL